MVGLVLGEGVVVGLSGAGASRKDIRVNSRNLVRNCTIRISQ